MTNILSMLGINEKDTEILSLKAELVNVLRKNVELSETVVELLKQRNALQDKLRKRGVV